jgi:hypothetical protein
VVISPCGIFHWVVISLWSIFHWVVISPCGIFHWVVIPLWSIFHWVVISLCSIFHWVVISLWCIFHWVVISCPGHIFTDNATEELRSNRSRITTEMWNSVIRYGSSTDTQRYEYGVRRIYHQKPPERRGLLRTDTVWYGATRIRTDALRIHYGSLRYKHGLVRLSTVWYGEERIDTEKNEFPRIYTDLIHPSSACCLLIFKMPHKKRTPRQRIAEFNDFGGEDSA